MPKGYAEGPAAEEAERRREELAEGVPAAQAPARSAVYGSTPEEPERHFLGWLGDVDPERLFASGAAWGITVVRRSSTDGDMSAPERSLP
jgi:hypothetical protein